MMIEAMADASGTLVALVTDPEGAAARRFAGCWRDPALDGEPEFLRKWAPRKEVRKASAELKAAVAEGHLKQHGPIVVASSHEEAEKHINAALAASAPAKAKKGDS